jgi:hypothetical protein
MRLVNVAEYESRPREIAEGSTLDYYDGGSHDEITLRKNVTAFSDITVYPRVFRGVGKRDTHTKVIGVNAAPGQEAATLKAVADGGRLATITGDPPREERGVAVSDVYVRPDGRQLSALAELLAQGSLSVPIASVRPLEQAAQALGEVVAGADGAIVLSHRN